MAHPVSQYMGVTPPPPPLPESKSYVQRRNLDDFPAKYNPALEFFFKIEILLYSFGAKCIFWKTTHPRVPQHSKYDPTNLMYCSFNQNRDWHSIKQALSSRVATNLANMKHLETCKNLREIWIFVGEFGKLRESVKCVT